MCSRLPLTEADACVDDGTPGGTPGGAEAAADLAFLRLARSNGNRREAGSCLRLRVRR